MILIGTCGFCKAMRSYFQDFKTVEVQHTFYKILKDETLRRWREMAPKDFIFSIKAFQGITHPQDSPTWRKSNLKPHADVGHLKPTDVVFKYWEITLKEAQILNAEVILIQLPRSFKENDASFKNAEGFFSGIDRRGFEIAVELREWSRNGIEKFVRRFDVIDVVDPLVRKPVRIHDINYYRLHGAYDRGRIIYRYRYSSEELYRIARSVKEWNAHTSYVYFNNSYMCEDARRLMDLISDPYIIF